MTHDSRALTTLSTVDYEQIEQAVMETARGRWFLKEYAARNRTADTRILLDAMQRLEGALNGGRSMEQVERVRNDLLDMASSIEMLRSELALGGEAGEPSRFGHATSALDAIVRTTEKATSDILGVAEQIQDIAWNLREQHHDSSVCDRIDKLATEIYTSCSFQDLTAQQTQKVIYTLRFLEGRINALIDAWSGEEPVSKPPSSKDDWNQEEILFAPADMHEQASSDFDFIIVDNDEEVAFEGAAQGTLAEADAQGTLAEADAQGAVPEAGPRSGDEGVDETAQHGDDLLLTDARAFEGDKIEIVPDGEVPCAADGAGHVALKPHSEPAPTEARMLAPSTPSAQAPVRSLAQIDAMTAAEKSLIFG